MGKPVRRGSKPWAFMERFVIPNFDRGTYLTRWRIVQTPYFAIFLHRMDTEDSRPTLHDHPWGFLSLVLRGGYTERRLNPETLRVDECHHVRRWNRIRSTDAHSILGLWRHPTWTLLFVGPRRRVWGYWEPTEGDEWTWTPFDRHRHNDEFLAALQRQTTDKVEVQ